MSTFSKLYPHIAWWVDNQGWIEIGTDENSDSLIRILDEGGMRWEDEDADTLDEALANAEAYLIEEFPINPEED